MWGGFKGLYEIIVAIDLQQKKCRSIPTIGYVKSVI